MAIHLQAVSLHADLFPTLEFYPFCLSTMQNTTSLQFAKSITLLVGENGTGKSTFIEAIARACDIHIWESTSGKRYKPNIHEKKLHHFMSLQWQSEAVPGGFFGSETFKDFIHILDEWAALDPGQLSYFGGESLVTKSHGQSMMAYFRSRYERKGIYFLDEPETALSPRSQLELLKIIRENAKGEHAQFIIATHSPILLACPDAQIFSFDHDPVQQVHYEDTELYQLYKNFLTDRERYL